MYFFIYSLFDGNVSLRCFYAEIFKFGRVPTDRKLTLESDIFFVVIAMFSIVLTILNTCIVLLKDIYIKQIIELILIYLKYCVFLYHYYFRNLLLKDPLERL